MKQKIKELIVVEGNSDVNFLSTFIDADFLITSGRGIKEETIEYIKKASQSRGVILFLDPDFMGEEIRRIIARRVKNVKHAFINPNLAKKNDKTGVAESSKEEVLRSLNQVITFLDFQNSLSWEEFFNLGLIGDKFSLHKRKKVEQIFSLGHGSAKTIFKRLNGLGITYEQILQSLGENHE